MITSVEKKKEEVRKNIENMFESATKKINEIISVCPDWQVDDIDLGYRSLTIHLKLKDVNIERNLDIRYDVKTGKPHKESFTTNVECCSTLNLIETNDYLKYYMAIGDILNHKDLLSLLKETMAYFLSKLMVLVEKYDDNFGEECL